MLTCLQSNGTSLSYSCLQSLFHPGASLLDNSQRSQTGKLLSRLCLFFGLLAAFSKLDVAPLYGVVYDRTAMLKDRLVLLTSNEQEQEPENVLQKNSTTRRRPDRRRKVRRNSKANRRETSVGVHHHHLQDGKFKSHFTQQESPRLTLHI